MILPTKHLRLDRSLFGLGADVLLLLENERTVSSLWETFKKHREQRHLPSVTFDWFVLALDFLHMAGVVDFADGHVRRMES